MPAEKGVARNLTRTHGVAERTPSWSPDGRWIAYFSDKTGEYELYVTQSDGRGETKQLTKDGKCYRYDPVWSPDSKHIVFTDKTGAIYLHTIDGETKLVDTDPYSNQADVRWSHESSWLTYAIESDQKNSVTTVYIYNVAEGTRHKISSGFFNSGLPTFDKEGDYLYFVSARAFNDPDYEDIGQSFIYSDTEVILAVPLRKDVEFPMMPESDEEEWDDEEDEDSDDEDSDKDGDDEDSDEDEDDEEEEKDSDEDSDEDDEESDDDADDEEADDDPLSGTWALELQSEEMPAEQRNAVMEIELAEDGSVTGTVDTPGGEEDIKDGKFDKGIGRTDIQRQNGAGHDQSHGHRRRRRTKRRDQHGRSGDQNSPARRAKTTKTVRTARRKRKATSRSPSTLKILPVAHSSCQSRKAASAEWTSTTRTSSSTLESAMVPRSNSLTCMRTKTNPKRKRSCPGLAIFPSRPTARRCSCSARNRCISSARRLARKLDDEVPTDGMKVMIPPREEWKQVFTDAWRIQRDFFYDPNMPRCRLESDA